MKDNTVKSAWKPQGEIEAKKQDEIKIKEEERKKEEERIKEIEESTDPSMDEIGIVEVGSYGLGNPELKITKREAMIKGYMDNKKDTIKSGWKSEKEIEAKKQDEIKINEEERKKEEERIKGIEESTDPSMDEIGIVEVGSYGLGNPELKITKREAMIKGYMDNGKSGIKSAWKPKGEITMESIQNAIDNEIRNKDDEVR